MKFNVLFYLVAGLLLAGCSTPPESALGSGDPASAFKRTMESTTETDQGAVVERFTLYSSSMDRDIRVAVVLPPAYFEDPDRDFPVLYAMHGANAPYDTYANMPILRKQLNEKPFIVITFDGDGVSRYIDSYYPVVTARRGVEDPTKRKSLFTTFFFTELVPAMESIYQVDSTKRGLTGFSMGGAGAFHYMLEQPEMFTSVSGLSGAFYDSRKNNAVGNRRGRGLERMLGERNEFPERYFAVDHYYRVEKRIDEGRSLPPIYLHCGSEDRLLDRSRDMHEFLEMNGFDITYLETEGAHNFAFWHPASVGVAEFHWKHFNE